MLVYLHNDVETKLQCWLLPALQRDVSQRGFWRQIAWTRITEVVRADTIDSTHDHVPRIDSLDIHVCLRQQGICNSSRTATIIAYLLQVIGQLTRVVR